MYKKPLVRRDLVMARAHSAGLRAAALMLVAASPLSCGTSNDIDEQVATDTSELLFRRRCPPGFADCDGRAFNGCEVALATDVGNCGACGNVCPIACSSGVCTGVCAPGSMRCSGSGLQTCGADGNWGTVVPCQTPNGIPACTAGVCVTAACNSGFGDCDGQAANGCETDLTTDFTSCGSCGTVCEPGGACVSGSCFPAP
jgi:hypothetical protein